MGALLAVTLALPTHTRADVPSPRLVRCVEVSSLQPFDLRGLRVSALGAVDTLWSPDSSRLCVGGANGIVPTAIADAAGGAIAGWVDGRSGNGDVYAQRLASSGALASGWPGDGLVVCSAGRSQYQLSMSADDAGGALFAWTDYRSGSSADIYVQRVTGSGAIATGWATGGSAVASTGADESQPTVIADGSGGVLLAWVERDGTGSRIRLGCMSGSGVVDTSWSTAAALLGDSLASVRSLKGTSDGSGGILLAWIESADSSLSRLKVARLSSSGELAGGWTSAGLSLGSSSLAMELSALVADGTGGALLAWLDDARGASRIRVGRALANGSPAPEWPSGGSSVCANVSVQFAPALRSDGAGGCYVAWQDLRSGVDSDIYLQRLNSAGAWAAGWPDTGTVMCAESGDQRSPALLVDSSGVVVVWADAASEGTGSYVSSLDAVRSAAPRLTRTDRYPGRAVITWQSMGPAAPGSAYTVERRLPGEEWKFLASLTPTANGELRIDDRNAPVGATVGYRLSLTAGDVQVYFAEVLVELPPVKPLALGTVRFGSGHRSLRVRFTLPGNERAPIALFDVGGRRMLERDLGEFGAGDHEVELSAHQTLAPGIYFVRLSQGAVARTARVALFR